MVGWLMTDSRVVGIEDTVEVEDMPRRDRVVSRCWDSRGCECLRVVVLQDSTDLRLQQPVVHDHCGPSPYESHATLPFTGDFATLDPASADRPPPSDCTALMNRARVALTVPITTCYTHERRRMVRVQYYP